MKANRRVVFWSVFLGGAAIAAVVPEIAAPGKGAGRAGVVPAVHRERPAEPAAAQAGEAAAAETDVDAAEAAPGARAGETAIGNLFAAKSWEPPPPPPPVLVQRAAPPPPPTAPAVPALPFVFLGKLDDAARLRVFLSRGDRVYTVSEGDLIDQTYRVTAIDPVKMTLLYLPLNQPQTLAIGNNLK